MSTAVPAPLTDWRTSFVGRERDVAAVAALLRAPGVSLVTITGPGGIGKTRLALRVADEVSDHFLGGLTVVSLGAIRDTGLVLPTIIQAFGLRAGDAPDLRRLAAALGDRPHLLLLDNFEHLTGEATLVSMLLAACPTLTVLVTSRAALRLSIEREYPLAPLSLADQRTGVRAAEVASSGAVELFVQRAKAVKPDFALTDDNAATIAEIVARLDGLPLAIELAAVRSKVLAPRALLARLSHRLSLLTGGARDMPERLRTMRDAIEWSYGLLDEEEQVLFRRLAVFDGSFTLEAAEAVASGGEGEWGIAGEDSTSPPLPLSPLPSVLDGIASLVDKSLLVHELMSEGESRYRMLETIREFAREELAAAGEETAVRHRHALWALALIEEARPHLYGTAQQPIWLQKLTMERDSFRGALNWAFENGEDKLGVLLAATLWGYWFSTDNVREGSAWLERSLGYIDVVPPNTRLVVYCGAGFLALVRLEFDHARSLLTNLLELATEMGSGLFIAWAHFGLGIVDQDLGEPARAETHFAAAEETFRSVGDRPAMVAMAMQNRGLVISRQGDHERGAALIEEALTEFRRLGSETGIALSSRFLGQVWRARGEDARAVPLLLEALRVKRNITQQWHIANALEALAGIAANHGQATLGATLFGAIEMFREQASAPLEPALQAEHDRAVAKLRADLGDAAFAAAWEAGRAMPIDEAIAEAANVNPGGAATAQPAAVTQPARTVQPAQPGTPADSTAAEDLGLTPREIDVLRLLAEGRSTGDIAETLFISPRTVSTHVASILGKLGVPTRSAAVALALRSNLV